VVHVACKLKVATKDELVIEPDDTAVDSNGGFLFGQLAIGARPSFVILDQDPRENVDALLDTKTHALFAIRQGVIIKNDFPAKAYPSPFGLTTAFPSAHVWYSSACPNFRSGGYAFVTHRCFHDLSPRIKKHSIYFSGQEFWREGMDVGKR